jgi:hypothetical protein
MSCKEIQEDRGKEMGQIPGDNYLGIIWIAGKSDYTPTRSVLVSVTVLHRINFLKQIKCYVLYVIGDRFVSNIA